MTILWILGIAAVLAAVAFGALWVLAALMGAG